MRHRLDDRRFADRTGRGVTIAILDSGIHADHPHLAGAVVAGGRSFADTSDDVVDRVGHGTAVAAAIHEKAPDARLIPVKLFDRQLATNAERLAQAIEWAAREGAHLINLSLGTSNAAHAARLEQAVAVAMDHGALIVAARETSGTPWYPGSLPHTVGVVADDACDRDEIDVRASGDDGVWISASIYPRPIPGVPRERNLAGISFAVANATGFLARALEGRERREPFDRGRPIADVLAAFS